MRRLFKCLWILLGFLSIGEMAKGADDNPLLWLGVSQSTVFIGLRPELAIDRSPFICSHSQTQTSPWWKLELMYVYRINSVAITSENSEYSNRINGAVIRIGNLATPEANPKCAEVSSIPAGTTANFSCGGMEGRYVMITIPGSQKTLVLCEVTIDGDLIENAVLSRSSQLSSQFDNKMADFAIDGSPGTCCQSNYQTDPWWKLEMMHEYQVNSVTFTTSISELSHWTDGAVIRVGYLPDVHANPLCAEFSSMPANATVSVSCGGMLGRYVAIIIPGDNKALVLCEVKVFGVLTENAALWRTVSQSSVSGAFVPEIAVDGVYNRYSQTMEQTDPWWKVDLLNEYRVNRIAITSIWNMKANWINGVVIRVGNVPDDIYSNPICAEISTMEPACTDTFFCGGMAGRYVIIHIPGDLKTLFLCEVEVYGDLIGNLAQAGAVTQSSTSGDLFAEKAIDGNRGLHRMHKNCSSTLNETNPWWRLDLGHIYKVNKVIVTNRNDSRADQINGAEIRIGNSLENNGSNNPICAVIPNIPAGKSYIYSCGGMEGRYVSLIIPGDGKTLALCEVEVYGEGDVGDEGPTGKATFVKMQFNSKADLTDPIIRERMVLKMESALSERGLANVTLRWSQTPKQKVMRKENTNSESCSRDP